MLTEKTVHRFGSNTIARVGNARELRALLTDPLFGSDPIIIKPNWISADPGEFSDAEAMCMLFEALDAGRGRRIVVAESYSIARSFHLQKRGRSFIAEPDGAPVDWHWLLKGAGWRWLMDHPDWEWFRREGHWEQLRAEDSAFREKYGFTDLFRQYGVDYLNVTEEIWSGRAAAASEIQERVEARFQPLRNASLYGVVPQALYELRGATLLSFARLKMYASFTFKNLFGMLPDPLKTWWHGPGNGRIAESVVEINKVYHALFPVVGMCEAFKTTAYTDPQGAHKGIFSGRYTVADGGGFVALGRDVLSLDALLLELSDPARRHIEEEAMRAPLALAEAEFGAIDRAAIEAARGQVQV